MRLFGFTSSLGSAIVITPSFTVASIFTSATGPGKADRPYEPALLPLLHIERFGFMLALELAMTRHRQHLAIKVQVQVSFGMPGTSRRQTYAFSVSL